MINEWNLISNNGKKILKKYKDRKREGGIICF